ncbi:MAG: hypothetical protein HY646_12985 [Acidobacteria bacterium]|nr:hypothetical protein [Acidobacteriota bacterium]
MLTLQWFEFGTAARKLEQAIVATLAFDSHQQPVITTLRGKPGDRQIILQTTDVDIDMTVHVSKSQASVDGQVLERGTADLLADLEVTVLQDCNPIATTRTDSLRNFRFPSVPVGALNIQVIIDLKSQRILGSFSISP